MDTGQDERITLTSEPGLLSPEVAAESGEDPLVGGTIDERYDVVRLIATGGMGCVYEAVDRGADDARVALKTLQPRFAARPRVVQRFLREAATLAATESPHVVKVTADGTLPDGRVYYVMEFLVGSALDAMMHEARGPLDPVRAVKIGIQIAEALEHAHAIGLMHRDLKPENVFLCEREGGDELVKLLDFGLAKALDGSMDVTTAGEVLGTPGYMAPEQIRGGHTDERTDIYAAGVVLYEMLTGRMPFDGDAVLDIMLAHVEQPVPLPSTLPLPKKLPALLEWIAMCCLYKDPARRFQTAAELKEELTNAARLYRLSV